jgi:hypothetical protein
MAEERSWLADDELEISLDLLPRSKIAIGQCDMPQIAFTHGFFHQY